MGATLHSSRRTQAVEHHCASGPSLMPDPWQEGSPSNYYLGHLRKEWKSICEDVCGIVRSRAGADNHRLLLLSI